LPARVSIWRNSRPTIRNGDTRAALAHEGINAAKTGIALSPNDPAPHFYLALNIGQLARTKLWTALGLIKDMEKAFFASIKADEKFNRASAHRSLGMLYQQAPGWPASIGSRSKARRHLEKAIELAPDFPDNHLTYMEALAAWDEKEHLRAALARYRKVLPEARQTYRGPEWEQPWRDWQARLADLDKKL
jgi:tetratricopeptide (TPR) repeat protein